MYSKLIGVSYRVLDLIQQGKEVKLEDFTIKAVSDVLCLDKTILLTTVQSIVFFFKQTQGKK